MGLLFILFNLDDTYISFNIKLLYEPNKWQIRDLGIIFR